MGEASSSVRCPPLVRRGVASPGPDTSARGAAAPAPPDPGSNTCTTRRDRPDRRPRRTTRLKSWLRVRRAAAGSTVRRRSGGQLLTTPAATSGHDRAAGPGAHAQPEPVGLGPLTIVRLIGALALAHGRFSRLLQAQNGHSGSVRYPPPARLRSPLSRLWPGPAGNACYISARWHTAPEHQAPEHRRKSSAIACPLVQRGTVRGYAGREAGSKPGCHLYPAHCPRGLLTAAVPGGLEDHESHLLTCPSAHALGFTDRRGSATRRSQEPGVMA